MSARRRIRAYICVKMLVGACNMREFAKICFVVGVCLANVIAGESLSVLLRSHSVYGRRNATYNSSSTTEPTWNATAETGGFNTTESSTTFLPTESSSNISIAERNSNGTTALQNATGTTGADSETSPTSSDTLSGVSRRRLRLLDRNWRVVRTEASNGAASEASTSASVSLKLPTESASNATSTGNGTTDDKSIRGIYLD